MCVSSECVVYGCVCMSERVEQHDEQQAHRRGAGRECVARRAQREIAGKTFVFRRAFISTADCQAPKHMQATSHPPSSD